VRRRLVILLAFIVVAPLCLMAWLGLELWEDERAMVRVRFDELLTSRLEDMAGSITRLMADEERELARITSDLDVDPDALRDAAHRERLVRQLFVLDAEGELVHPPKGERASATERAFLERTERIFRDGAPFLRATGEEPARSRSGRRVAPSGDYHGWHVWYWDEGISLLYWRRDAQGRIFGAEVSRVVLLADIVAALPDTDPDDPSLPHGRIQLADASGRPVYGFGGLEPEEGQAPRVRLPLADPLGSWELRYFVGEGIDESFGGSMLINLFVALGALALAVVGFAVYFYREQSRELREAGQRVTFVNQVSHELKTPLTNIRMYAELMEDQLDEEEERLHGYLGVIVSESQRLSRLIANVLTFGRARESRLTIRPVPGVVDRLIDQVVSQFEPSFSAKEIEISLVGGAPDRVLVDADALGQILGNLLGNVEKYAAAGGRVEISRRREGSTTLITVSDRGPGIPRGDEERVFRPFFRHSRALTAGASGTGIGLGIARDLARLHGGDLELEPSEEGARFRLTLRTPKEDGR
jgi:signal transduction histidine kinase